MAISDVEKMVAVGLVWGATNALMRKGALIWDNKSKLLHSNSSYSISLALRSCLHLVLTWQYSLPLAVNLSASAAFFAVLAGDAPISLAVPVTNATTFTATAVAGVFLGEEIRVWRALLDRTSEVKIETSSAGRRGIQRLFLRGIDKNRLLVNAADEEEPGTSPPNSMISWFFTYFKEDGVENDPTGASRGKWWQGIIFSGN